jgi:hypothetical protein
MAPSIPTKRAPTLPAFMDGAIFQNVGKYARGAVLYAFEEIGGPPALAEWAKTNEGEFYTKLFPKIIARESEVHHVKSIEELMDVIDGDYEVEGDETVYGPQTINAEYGLKAVDAPIAGRQAFPEGTFVDPEFDEFDIDDLVEFEE